MRAFLPLLLAVVLTTGCTEVSVKKQPKLDLSKYHRIFVEQPFNENHHVDEYLAAELRAVGCDATSGPLTMMPENTDAVLSYAARWNGDFKLYLIELDIGLRTPHTNKPLAEGRYYQPSAFTKPPAAVAHELITRLFSK
jgi:hypothetical protein